MLIGIGAASDILGVSIKSMRRHDKIGTIIAYQTAGGYRRYDKEALYGYLENGFYEPKPKQKTGGAVVFYELFIQILTNLPIETSE